MSLRESEPVFVLVLYSCQFHRGQLGDEWVTFWEYKVCPRMGVSSFLQGLVLLPLFFYFIVTLLKSFLPWFVSIRKPLFLSRFCHFTEARTRPLTFQQHYYNCSKDDERDFKSHCTLPSACTSSNSNGSVIACISCPDFVVAWSSGIGHGVPVHGTLETWIDAECGWA